MVKSKKLTYGLGKFNSNNTVIYGINQMSKKEKSFNVHNENVNDFDMEM